MKLCTVALLAALAHAQPPDRRSFEVASIKLHPEPITMSRDPSIHGSRIVGTASTLLDLIEDAYGLRRDQIMGAPPWAESDHYDLAAKAEGEAVITKDQFRQMMQSLLADRFQLQTHRETVELPIYALVVAKNGPKFQPSPPDAPNHGFVRGDAKGLHMEATRGTMAQLALQLCVTAGRPVLDRTGLTGIYTYTLDWFPANRTPPPDLDAPPSMFQALKDQLGLTLESTKGPVERLVVDHVANPSEN